MTSHLILAINPGSGSTKFGLFRDAEAQFVANARHRQQELAAFAGKPMVAQLGFRRGAVESELQRRGIDLPRINAVVGRGGLLRPLASGTYHVNRTMLEDLRAARRGEHASNLGAFIAYEIAQEIGCPAFIVDPVSVDEWPPVARLSGLAGLDRECLSHALNTKAVAKRFAREQGKRYDELQLIVAHLGSGISVSAHEGGRMIDVTNSRDEGAFSTERAGAVPVMKLVERCFSGESTRPQIEAELFREGGTFSYLGTRDLEDVLRRVDAGDAQAALVYDAMLYQVAKEIGAMATVLRGRVHAILLTGGMTHSARVVDDVRARAGWIAPLHVFAGEDELQALAEGALRVLRGEEAARDYGIAESAQGQAY